MTRSIVVRLALLALVLGACLSVPHASDLPDVETVLKRFVEAVGGQEALEKRDSRKYRGTIFQDLSWKDPQHQETPFVAETDVAGRVLYAESASPADLPAADSGEPRRKLRWLMHPRFALVVEEFFPGLRVVWRELRNGRSVVVLEPAELQPEHYSLYFDEATGLLSHIGYYNDLLEWREVDGVMFPTRFVFSRKGGHTTYVFE